MNKLILPALIFLSSLNALAAARDFRVSREDISKDGYAIAWGIPGQKLDFEAIDADDAKIDELIDRDEAKNYLVDIETDKILLNLTEDEGQVEYSVGGRQIGNHFNLSISKVHVEGLQYAQEAVAVTSETRWEGGISHLAIVDRSASPKILTLSTDINQKIAQEIISKLSKKDQKAMENYVFSLYIAENIDKTNTVRYVGGIPKTDDYATITANVQLKLVNGKIESKVLSQKVTRD